MLTCVSVFANAIAQPLLIKLDLATENLIEDIQADCALSCVPAFSLASNWQQRSRQRQGGPQELAQACAGFPEGLSCELGLQSVGQPAGAELFTKSLVENGKRFILSGLHVGESEYVA
eukprot:373626-Pelagomonas_calceolata.AAC.1